MGKLSKAKDFYLRGFKSNYIRRRTGMGVQSLLNKLSINGVRFNQNDIIDYQVNYIESKYSECEIQLAFEKILNDTSNIHRASKRGEIVVLGCCFGRFEPVFKRLLGESVYNELV